MRQGHKLVEFNHTINTLSFKLVFVEVCATITACQLLLNATFVNPL